MVSYLNRYPLSSKIILTVRFIPAMWTIQILKDCPQMAEELFEVTLNLLKNRSAQLMLKQIAADTGIKYSWICALHNNRLKNEYAKPSAIKKLEKLNKYLVSKLNPTLT